MKRIRKAPAPDSETETSSDSDPDSSSEEEEEIKAKPTKRPPKGNSSKQRWSAEQMASLRKNYRFLATLDDSVVACLTFKDIVAMAGRDEKSSKVLTERLAANFETVNEFPTWVEAGEDHCTGKGHPARFLRGYVGNSQELWLQGRLVQGRAGLPPISNYETVSIGLNGFVSSKVWHELHSPSSKALSIRMLSNSAMKSAWNDREKTGEQHDFVSLQELRMATVALEAAVHKVMPWNFSVTTVAMFLHSINFGEVELSGKGESLSFLADFIDEILRHNAQAWDEGRHFLSSTEVAAKWSAMVLRRSSVGTGSVGRKSGEKREKNPGPEVRIPRGLCRYYQDGKCKAMGEKHSAPWDSNHVLHHKCAKWLVDQNRYCMEPHSKKDHK